MFDTAKTAVAVIGIDIGKNSFHVVGLDQRGAIALRQRWSRGQVEARLLATHGRTIHSGQERTPRDKLHLTSTASSSPLGVVPCPAVTSAGGCVEWTYDPRWPVRFPLCTPGSGIVARAGLRI
jgi:hypothetical protein